MTYDLNLVPDAQGRLLFRPGAGTVIDSYSKAAQKLVMRLLTEQGTVLSDADEGTVFVTKFKRNGYRTDFQFQSGASNGLLNAVRQLAGTFEDGINTEDELVAEAVLNRFEIMDNTVVLYITVTTAAGDSFPVTVPVTDISSEEE